MNYNAVILSQCGRWKFIKDIQNDSKTDGIEVSEKGSFRLFLDTKTLERVLWNE